MIEPVRLTRQQARRYLVHHHALQPPRSLPASPESVLELVRRLSILQFDPLEVPGARNHDLVLHARIQGYRREWTDSWLYGPNRRLFEIYNKSLNIVPIEELPHHRVSWDRFSADYEQGILREHADVVQNILQRIADEGPLSTAAFSDHSHSVDWWWAPTRVARAVLEALFVIGRRSLPLGGLVVGADPRGARSIGGSICHRPGGRVETRREPPLLRPHRAARP